MTVERPRWVAGLPTVAAVQSERHHLRRALAGSDVHDWEVLLDVTSAHDADDPRDMVGPLVRIGERDDHVVLCGRGIEDVMAHPFDLQDSWDVVEGAARPSSPGGPR